MTGQLRNVPVDGSLVSSDLRREFQRQRKEPFAIERLDHYMLSVHDATVLNPFVISQDLVKVIRNRTRAHQGPGDKARAIFDWMQAHVTYGTSRRRSGYKNSQETLRDREGVCGEMAYLYIAMARCCGLRSSYVSVTRDNHGDRVYHGCAAVELERRVLVDPAYHVYDILHREYVVLSDREVMARFAQWRGSRG